MKDTIEEIKRKLDIVEFVGAVVQLKRAGRNFKANCPFHNEKTPSFVVSPDRQTWRCFGACQEGGDIISFLMKLENITFYEALKELAHQAGVVIKNLDFEDKAWSEKEKLININNAAAKMYHYLLQEHASGAHAREYLEQRGLNKGLIETFQLGYAPQSWDTLYSYLRKKGHTEGDIIKAGLALKGSSGKTYDRFRGRLMFPIINTRNVILGFSGRLLHDQEKQAKYVNTPETLLYRKRETLFGIHVAKDSIVSEKSAILVEGEFDMMSSFKHGIKNVVAVKGSAVTREQLQLLKRYTQHLILALDADFSGAETTKRAIQDAEELEFRIDVLRAVDAKDPDEALKADPIAFKKLVKKPIPIYDFIINTAIERHSMTDPYEKAAALTEIIPFIEHITNPIVFSHYLKLISEKMDIDENDVTKSLYDFRKKKKIRIETSKKTAVQELPISRPDMLEKYIMAVMVQAEDIGIKLQQADGAIDESDLAQPSYKEIFKHLNKVVANSKKAFDLKMFVSSLSEPLQEVFDELFLFDISNEEINESNFMRMLHELKRYSLKKKISTLMKEDQENTHITELSKEIAEVEKHLSDMYN